METRNYCHVKMKKAVVYGVCFVFCIFYTCVFMHMSAIKIKAATQGESLVSTAKSQLGIKERSSDSDDIIYNDWYYGRRVNNNGKSAKYAWCAVFVSWCAERSGISTGIIPKMNNTTNMKNMLINSGGTCHLKGSGYSPKCGDIIFFGSNASQHVGIVEYSSQNRVYYIDGNNTQTNPHGVHYSNCSLSYSSLWGFVTPNYSVAEPSEPQSSLGNIVDLGDSFSARIRHCASGKVVTNSNYNAVIGTSMNEKIARQIWKFTRNGNGSYKIQSCLNEDYCLELHDFNDFDGGNVCCAPINGSSAQSWFIYKNNDGTICMQPECSKTRILDLSCGDTADGNNMQIWSVNNTNAQKFGIDICAEVINVGEDFSGFIMNSHYWKPIMQDSKNNVVLGTENSKYMAQQLWHFVRNSQNGYYTIESYYNGKVLTVEDSKDEDGANVICSEKNGSASQQWFILMRSDGSRYLKAACSVRNLDLLSDSKADGTNIQMWRINNTEAQTFSIYALYGGHNKISYDLLSDSASIDIGEKTEITVSNALYGIDYKLHIVAPDGKTSVVNMGTKNTYDFRADTKGIYKIYASVKSPVSSYSGSVNDKCISIAVGYDYETSAEQSDVFQGHLYQLVRKQNVNWAQAKRYCEDKHSYLAAITSEEENNKVAGLIRNCGEEAYIGGVRKDAENFRWIDASGEEFNYSNWRAGEPNYCNHGTCQIRDPYGEYAKENYIGMYTDGTWNDYMVKSSDINAFVMESVVTSLQVSIPIKTTYKIGDRFNKNSIVVEAEFSDGSRRKVTDYTISGFDPNKSGVQKVIISYFGVSQSIDVMDEGKVPDKGKENIDEEKDPDKGSGLNEEDTKLDEEPGKQEQPSANDDVQEVVPPSQEKEEDPEEDFDEEPDGEESHILHVGDVVEDAKTGDEYEIIFMDGSTICVEYMESANPKVSVIKIPATIETEDGTVCRVTAISKCAFKNNRRIKKVVIGSNVTVIGTKAFSGCKNLITVTMGINMTEISANAFSNCTKLTSLTIPAKVAKIGANAFSGCKKLKKLDIKSTKLNSKKLNKKAFRGIPLKTVIRISKEKSRTYKKLLYQRGLNKKNRIEIK